MSEVVVGCMHLRHIRYDDWEIVCKDCGADLSDNLEIISQYVPDSFMREWYDYPPTTDVTLLEGGHR